MKIERIDATTLTVEIGPEAEMGQLGRSLAQVVGPGVVIGLVGTLGAGKTRLVRAIAEALGVDPGAIASPTFVLIHEYPGRLPISHFDAYRLADPDEFDALGASDHWADGDRLCLVEWADLVSDRLPRSTWWVRIVLVGDGGRRVRVESPASEQLAGLLEPSRAGGCGVEEEDRVRDGIG